MIKQTFFTLSLALMVGACASTPDVTTTSGLDPYDYYAFDRLSRIEIAQKLRAEETALDLSSSVLTVAADDRVNAHQRSAKRNIDNSNRLRNKAQSGEGRSYYFQAQNSFGKDGWVIDNERLRHVDSGLLCPSDLEIAEESRLFALERVVEFDDAGRDIACIYQASDNGDPIAIFASYWPEITIEDHAAMVVQSIRQTYTVTEEISLPVVELTAEDPTSEFGALVAGMETPLAGGFEIGEVTGVNYRTSLWMVKTHGWHVKLQSSYASTDEITEFLSAVHFMASHLSVRAKNMADPISSGTDV